LTCGACLILAKAKQKKFPKTPAQWRLPNEEHNCTLTFQVLIRNWLQVINIGC
jgi:hypothetical protein